MFKGAGEWVRNETLALLFHRLSSIVTVPLSSLNFSQEQEELNQDLNVYAHPRYFNMNTFNVCYGGVLLWQPKRVCGACSDVLGRSVLQLQFSGFTFTCHICLKQLNVKGLTQRLITVSAFPLTSFRSTTPLWIEIVGLLFICFPQNTL